MKKKVVKKDKDVKLDVDLKEFALALLEVHNASLKVIRILADAPELK